MPIGTRRKVGRQVRSWQSADRIADNRANGLASDRIAGCSMVWMVRFHVVLSFNSSDLGSGTRSRIIPTCASLETQSGCGFVTPIDLEPDLVTASPHSPRTLDPAQGRKAFTPPQLPCAMNRHAIVTTHRPHANLPACRGKRLNAGDPVAVSAMINTPRPVILWLAAAMLASGASVTRPDEKSGALICRASTSLCGVLPHLGMFLSGFCRLT